MLNQFQVIEISMSDFVGILFCLCRTFSGIDLRIFKVDISDVAPMKEIFISCTPNNFGENEDGTTLFWTFNSCVIEQLITQDKKLFLESVVIYFETTIARGTIRILSKKKEQQKPHVIDKIHNNGDRFCMAYPEIEITQDMILCQICSEHRDKLPNLSIYFTIKIPL